MAAASEKAVTRGRTDLSDKDGDADLPASVVIGPDEDGITKTTEFRLDRVPARRPSTATGGNSTREVYIPPKREPVFYTPGRREKVAALCVTNLPEETDEFDVQLLFGRFGPIARLAVAVNPRTGRGRGFAFVNFVYKDHAEKAMLRVDGHRYGHLILRVRWENDL